MKVLLDENLPESVLPAFDRYETWHVNELGWQGKKNGELLHAASERVFDVLVTTDVNLYSQQKARLFGIAIIVLRVFSNAPAGVRPLVNEAQDSMNEIQPGEVKYIYIDQRLQQSDQRRRRGEFAD